MFYIFGSRFIQCTYQRYPPSSSIQSDTITFDLNKFESATIYQIQNCCIDVKCKITKRDGSLPGTCYKNFVNKSSTLQIRRIPQSQVLVFLLQKFYNVT